MGVQGLWQLLNTVGRPVTLESLENKILAIDVSIWLHQAVQGCRIPSGSSVNNAHLVTLFNRICKLLFYRIKPVFVFDGGIPLLKKQTIAARRQKKEMASKESHKALQKMLKNIIKREAIKKRIDCGKDSKTVDEILTIIDSSRQPDVFQLSELPKETQTEFEELNEESSEEDGADIVVQHYCNRYQDIDSVDIHSESFLTLPLDIQHEILNELKETRKKNSWAMVDEMPKESHNFSSYQMARLIKRRTLQHRLDEIEKEMKTAEIDHLPSDIDKNIALTSQRILSEDGAHYILARNLKERNQKPAETISTVVIPEPKQTEEKNLVDDIGNYDIMDEILSTSSNDSVEVLQRVVENCTKKNGEGKMEDKKEVLCFTRLRNEMPEFNFVTEGQKNQRDKDVGGDNLLKELPLVAKVKESIDKSEKVVDVQLKANQSPTLESIKNDDRCKVDEKLINTEVKSTNKDQFDKSDPPKESTFTEITSPDLRLTEITSKDSRFTETTSKDLRFTETTSKDSRFTEITSKGSKFAEITSKDSRLTETTSKDSRFTGITLESIPSTSTATAPLSTKASNSEESSDDSGDFVDVASLVDEDSESNLEISNESQINKPQVKQNEDKIAENELANLSVEELNKLDENLQEENANLQKTKAKCDSSATNITDQMYTDCQELLKLFGIPYIISPMEAEAQCATLDLLDLTHGTITDDSDIWLFGGRKVYRNFFNQSKFVEFFKAADIEQHFNLNRLKLICLALMTGSDYTDGIEGVGCVTAMEVLSEFKEDGLECLKSFKNWWETARQNKSKDLTPVKKKLYKLNLPPGFPNETIAHAYLEPTVDNSSECFSWSKPDLAALRDFAQFRLGWAKNKVDELLVPVLKKINLKESQSRIDNFFKITLTKDSPKVVSKRLRRAIRKVANKTGEIEEETPREKAVKILKRKKCDEEEKSTKKQKSKRSSKKNPQQNARKITEAMLSEDSSD